MNNLKIVKKKNVDTSSTENTFFQYLSSKDDKCQKRDAFLNDSMMGICLLFFYNHKFNKLFHKYWDSYHFMLHLLLKIGAILKKKSSTQHNCTNFNSLNCKILF